MKLREDANILEYMVEGKLISINQAKEMAALSLIITDHATINEEYDKFTQDLTDNPKPILFDVFPFDEFVAIVNNETMMENKTVKVIGHYVKLSIKDQTHATLSFQWGDNYWVTVDIEIAEVGFLDFSNYKVKAHRKLGTVLPFEKQEIAYQAIHKYETPRGMLSNIYFFCLFNEQKDRYAISRTENKKPYADKNTNKGKITKVLGPRVIYLDKLPDVSDKDVESIGTGSPKAPHQRRGSWCTLRAERYKNHPLYQVEKAIYRKPAWIGDRSRIVHGATYTVIDRQINLED